MNNKKAIQILTQYNKWRRGAEMPMQDVKEIGIAIDTLINENKRMEKYIQKKLADKK